MTPLAPLVLCLAAQGVAPGAAPAEEQQYRHSGLGFAVDVPDEATRMDEGDPVTERGIHLALPSEATIRVFGEPNSLELPSPEAGVRDALAGHKGCAAGSVRRVRVGALTGAGGRVQCGASVTRYLLVFRPGGGPIYWLRLDTSTATERDDVALFAKVAASFAIIPWE